MQVYVAVVGPGDAGPDVEAQAAVVGDALARAGAVVVTGGLGGVMAAASRAAKQAGGATVGVLPGPDRSAANPWVDVALATGMGEARNALVVRTSDVVVALGGGFGTLSEIALALKMGRPVVGLATWDIAGVERARSPGEAADRALALARAVKG